MQREKSFFYLGFIENSKEFRYLNKSRTNDLYREIFIGTQNNKSVKENYEIGGQNQNIASTVGNLLAEVIIHLYDVDNRIKAGINSKKKKVKEGYSYQSWKHLNASERIDYLEYLKLYDVTIINMLNSLREDRNGQHDPDRREAATDQVVDQDLEDFHDVLAYFYNYYEVKNGDAESFFNPRLQSKAYVKGKINSLVPLKFDLAWHGKKEETTEEKDQYVIPEKPIETDLIFDKKKSDSGDSKQKRPEKEVKGKKDTEPIFTNKEKLKSVVNSTKNALKKIDPKKVWTYAKVAIGVGVALLILSGAISTISGVVHSLFPGNNDIGTEEVNDNSDSETSTTTSNTSDSKSNSKERFNPAIFQFYLAGYDVDIYKNGQKTKDVGEPRIHKGYTEEDYIVSSNLSNHVVVVSRNSRAQEIAKDKELFKQTYEKQKKEGVSGYLYDPDKNELTLKLHDIDYYVTDSGYINVDKNLKLNKRGEQKIQSVFNNPRNGTKGLVINKNNNQKITLTNEDFINAGSDNYRVVYDFHFELDSTYVAWS
ncbi:hypothetical protein J2Z60_001597 [Lactobacillus colini]|uniref:Uncharacterized protein n=1 Tax=Lactobacillus colini TaxID=1819254 RepID=A0ABS4MFG5_9LACO|nr:hypothetical protein [Lactobacillus colini]MBP2058418.1 hypothetical protein [Lactobacillus colini]